MLRSRFAPPSFKLIEYCRNLKTLKQIHASLIVSGFTDYDHVTVSSKLIHSYYQYQDFGNAVLVFDSLHGRPNNTYIWNLILITHVDLRRFDSAFELYKQMRYFGVEHDGFTFPIVNRAVSSSNIGIEYGEIVHSVAVKTGFEADLYLCNTLIEVYLKYGVVCSARKVFDDMCLKDIVSWTSMISGYGKESCFADGFKLFGEMRIKFEQNPVTVIIVLQLCSSNRRVIEGKQIHGFVIGKGFLVDGSLQNSMLRMYTLMGLDQDVETLWTDIDIRDFISWNIMISFYSSRGYNSKVVESLNRMQADEVKPSVETLTLVVSSIARTESGCHRKGDVLHCYAIKSGLFDNVLKTCLLDFYAKLGSLEAAVSLFSEISSRSSITWNAIICGFIQNGYCEEAVDLFKQMQVSGLKPEAEILNSLVIAFTHMGMLRLGKVVHGYLIRNLHDLFNDNSSILQTSILNMYLRSGSISFARRCFDQMVIKDIVAWTSMIEGLGNHGLGYDALKLFHLMMEEQVQPNSITFLSLLSACSHSGLVSEGCETFYAMKWVYGIEPDLVHYTCVVDLLGRHGKLKEALAIILKMVVLPDSRIWGALFASARVYEDRNIGEYAAKQVLKMEPDNVGYYTLLSNINARNENWGEVEEVRRKMTEIDLKPKPGWSCVG